MGTFLAFCASGLLARACACAFWLACLATFGIGSGLKGFRIDARSGVALILFGRPVGVRDLFTTPSSSGVMGFIRRPLTAADVPCAVFGLSNSALLALSCLPVLLEAVLVKNALPLVSASDFVCVFFKFELFLAASLIDFFRAVDSGFSALSISPCRVLPPIAKFFFENWHKLHHPSFRRNA